MGKRAVPRQVSIDDEKRSGGQMQRKRAPSQQPKPRKTIRGSRMRRVKRDGMRGVMESRARATWAPMISAPRERARVEMMTARRAMKE